MKRLPRQSSVVTVQPAPEKPREPKSSAREPEYIISISASTTSGFVSKKNLMLLVCLHDRHVRAQAVGCPPVRSFRKNVLADRADKAKAAAAMVKIQHLNTWPFRCCNLDVLKTPLLMKRQELQEMQMLLVVVVPMLTEGLQKEMQQNEKVKKVVLANAPEKNKMVAPKVQMEIASCFAEIIVKSIVAEIGNGTNGRGSAIRRQLGSNKRKTYRCCHVKETTVACLQSNIDYLFNKYGLSLKKVRGQGYDGASNMRASCKRKDMIRESQQERVRKGISNGHLSGGTEILR
uniref:Auxin-responsive protein n=1 Tax=Oryza brachyantha TaxID=4533 RepID=J3KUB3_ORYBR